MGKVAKIACIKKVAARSQMKKDYYQRCTDARKSTTSYKNTQKSLAMDNKLSSILILVRRSLLSS